MLKLSDVQTVNIWNDARATSNAIRTIKITFQIRVTLLNRLCIYVPVLRFPMPLYQLLNARRDGKIYRNIIGIYFNGSVDDRSEAR